MPRVPTYDGAQVRSAPLQGGAQDYARSDAAFGGEQARQLQDVGKAAGHLGTAVSQLAERQMLRDDTAKADAAFVTLQNEYNTQALQWKKDRVGFKAEGLVEDTDKWWAEAEQRTNANLNDRQRQLLQQSASRLRTTSLAGMGEFQEFQKRDVSVKAGTAFISGQIQEAAGNPKLAAASRISIHNKVAELATLNGWTPEIAEQETKRYSTIMHGEVINTLLAGKNPEEAKRYFEQAKALGDFDETRANDMQLKIDTKVDAKRASDLADSLSGQPLEAALATIAKEENTDVRKAARQQYLLNQKDEELIKSQREKASSDKVWQAVANGRKPAQADLDNMDGKERVQVNAYYEAKAKAAVDKASGKLHAKEDNYEALDMAEAAIKQGDITDPRQLERYAPFLRAETFRTLRKSLEKRSEVPRSEVEKVFMDRLGKSKAKMNDGERKQWIAFQDYVNENVRETKRPEDLEGWADRWFMKGYGKDDSIFTNDPGTLGEARAKGRKDFVVPVPEGVAKDVDGALAVVRAAGVKAPIGKIAADEFYTNYYLDASRWFGARGESVSASRAAAYSILKQNNKPVTPANINAVIEQLKGVTRAQPGQPAR